MDEARKKISKGVLEMKFMQKTKQRIERNEIKQKEAENKQKFIDANQTEDTSAPLGVEIINDIAALEDLKFGRMSFKGYNPEVEKLMIYYERIRRGEDSDESDDEKDVSDKEMAETLGSGASSSLRKKFASKSDRSKMVNDSRKRFNFDESSIRKRTNDKTWAEERKPKFQKPNEDI